MVWLLGINGLSLYFGFIFYYLWELGLVMLFFFVLVYYLLNGDDSGFFFKRLL